MPPTIAAPTTELGAPTRTASAPGPYGTYAIYDERERARDLRWPRNVQETYPAMMNDAQIDGMYRAMMWAVRAFDYWLEPNGAAQTAVDRISRNYNLPVGRGTTFNRRRGQRRFSFEQHMEDALRAPGLGHYAFEQAYDVTQDGPATINGGWVANLRKLAPRPPAIISEIGTAPDGGLEYIKVPAQRPRQGNPGTGLWMRDVPLPVDRIVFYAWDKEGANWRGRSMLRSLYRPWKLKDAVMRDGAINIRRAGGVPYANAPQDADPKTRDSILEVLRDFRMSDDGAAVFPYGTELKFASAAGGGEAVNYVKLQNEEMARAWLLTFMQLGQTQSGSRALAEPLIDYVQLGQMVIAKWFIDLFNEHVLEDDVDLNEGPGEEYAPIVACAPKGDPLEAFQGALDDAASVGALPDDSGVMAMIRDARAGAGGRAAQRRFRRPVNAVNEVPGGDRPEHEQYTNWDDLDEQWRTARYALVEAWLEIRDAQVTELEQAIRNAGGDLEQLAQVSATPAGSELVADAMRQIAEFGVRTARDEARAQGATLPSPDMEELGTLLEARSEALTELLARSISEAGARQAVQRTGGALLPQEVATEVGTHLRGLSNAYLEDQIGGALTQGLNGGRRWAMQGAPTGTRYVGSALLDSNACEICRSFDGHEFVSLEDAERQYPTGGNKDCLGGPRCRCTIVAIYGEAAPTVA